MELDRNEVRALAFGKFLATKCPCCDNEGRVWFDGKTGLGAAPYPPGGVATEDIAWEPCDVCEGVGYKIRFMS